MEALYALNSLIVIISVVVAVVRTGNFDAFGYALSAADSRDMM